MADEQIVPTPESTPEVAPAPEQSSAPSTLTEHQIIQAATNDPQLAEDEFRLGDRIFKIIDLEYDAYLKFVLLLKPFITAVFGLISQKSKVGIPGIELSNTSFSEDALLEYCGVNLPEMARIVCASTDPDITVDDVKKLGKTPFNLAKVVMAQVQRNNIIKDFTDFFVQALPMLGMTGK